MSRISFKGRKARSGQWCPQAASSNPAKKRQRRENTSLLDFFRLRRKISAMLPFQPKEFGLSVRCDNRLMAVRVAHGEAVELYEVVELMSDSKCLFDLTVLVARELKTVRDCLVLWSSMRDQFAELCWAWEGVPQNGELTAAYRAQLMRLKGLCEDRRAMYVVTAKERQRHAKNRDSNIESFGVRNGSEVTGYSSEGRPGHVYAWPKLGYF
jgi:hypothetical protein